MLTRTQKQKELIRSVIKSATVEPKKEAVDQGNKVPEKDLLYYVFLEAARQVSLSNKELGTLLLRTWNAYHEAQEKALHQKVAEAQKLHLKMTALVSFLEK